MRREMRAWGTVVAGCLWLAACGGQPPYEEGGGVSNAGTLPAAEAVSTAPLDSDTGEGGSDVVTAEGPGGLVERMPDTCQLENYRQFVGQDALNASFRVTDRPVRIIAPDAIVSQVYDPRRVNFYTDAAGRVGRISCG